MRSIAVRLPMVKRFWLLVLLATPATGQLYPPSTPLPKTTLPPVVFLNGYQAFCGNTQFSNTFGSFDQYLQTTARVSVFFDNCSIAGKPSIESLGNSFGTFLNRLKYADGSAVTQVDIVAHSMGGLIVRAYLAGMQPDGTFQPPASPGIRKAVFLSTPNFGTPAAAVFSALTDIQTQELSNGSIFSFSLATWNQGIDDLRGIDALAVAGNAGQFRVNGQPNGDGVSSLTSSSIGFAQPDKTRILPYCHISYADLTVLLAPYSFLFPPSTVCTPGSQGIAKAVNATDSNVLIVLSFLNGTPDWQSIGQAPAENPLASVSGGVLIRAKNANDNFLSLINATAAKTALTLAANNSTAYAEFVAAGNATLTVDLVSNPQQQQPVTIAAGSTTAVTVKPGPLVAAVIPAAALVTPRAIAPGTFISIYGTGLATATAQAADAAFPTVLGGTQVLVNGAAIALQYVSPTQINAVFPLLVNGLVTVNVTTTAGQHTVNVLVQSAVPAVFTTDGTAAAALNAVTGTVVTPSAPLRGGDFVSLFVTGLGATAAGAGGLQYATLPPSVTVAGKACAVQFAGLSPQFPGVDQINCRIPVGLGTYAAAPVVVSSGGRSSNIATLVLQ
jgi:uncharacterized protein (TIGR03437 family)